MLRPIDSHNLGLRILPFDLAYAGGVPVVNGGVPVDFSSITDNGTGDATFNIDRGFQREEMLFASRTGSPTTPGGYAYADAVSGNNKIKVVADDGAGSGEDADTNGLIVGFDSDLTYLVKKHQVRSSIRRSRMIGGIFLGATAVVSVGKSDFTIVNNDVGEYTITFRKPFSAGITPIVLVTTVGTTELSHVVVSRTVAGCVLNFFDTSGVAAEADFHMIVLGTDMASAPRGGNSLVLNSQRKPKLIALRVSNAATPAINIHSEYGTVADSGLGTGDKTITLGASYAFGRTPVCILAPHGATGNSSIVSASASALRLQTFNAAGSLADIACQVLMLGSDDSVEY